MARPRKAPETEHGDGRPILSVIAPTLEHLRTATGEGDGEPDTTADMVAGALAALAVGLDALHARLDELRELVTAVHEDAVDRTRPTELAELVHEPGLAERVTELEQRVHEAGRRMVFVGENPTYGRNPHPSRWLPEIGRALLFEGEQPEAGGGVSGTAEVETLTEAAKGTGETSGNAA